MMALTPLLISLLRILPSKKLPKRLLINNRPVLTHDAFQIEDFMFRKCSADDLDGLFGIRLETIRFPDVSCNWGRFSKPYDVWFISSPFNYSLGCYSINVGDVEALENIRIVHDPIEKGNGINNANENYSHCEIRVNKENNLGDPPREVKWSKSKKMEFRLLIKEKARIIIKPTTNSNRT